MRHTTDFSINDVALMFRSEPIQVLVASLSGARLRMPNGKDRWPPLPMPDYSTMGVPYWHASTFARWIGANIGEPAINEALIASLEAHEDVTVVPPSGPAQA